MSIVWRGEEIQVFAISPRTTDPASYVRDIESVTAWSDRFGLDGVLLFTGNDTYLDPWMVAQNVMASTRRLSPLVAVNPLYMHPFSAAKMVSSLAQMYGRRTYLNMVTGTAQNYLDALGPRLSHDERYQRLEEYILLMKALLTSSAPVTWKGRFYEVSSLSLLPGIPAALSPRFLLAGQSDAALRVARSVDAIGMQMLGPGLEGDVRGGVTGIHFGLLARQDDRLAWARAREAFPDDPVGRQMFDLSMANTDSVWKHRLRGAAGDAAAHPPSYFLSPFRSSAADCPYFVGSHAEAASLLVRLVLAGIRTFIFDLPATEEDFEHAAKALRLAKDSLVAEGQQATEGAGA